MQAVPAGIPGEAAAAGSPEKAAAPGGAPSARLALYAAPMEGITGFPWRNAHALCCGGIDRYYSPFLATYSQLEFKKRDIRDVTPSYNLCGALIPQVLTNKPRELIWAAEFLEEMGYAEINLNLGCPSPTVVTKRKGAGFLADPEELDAFFGEAFGAEVFARVRLSVKTRIGAGSSEHGLELMEVYNRWPISEVIIHPRTQKELYGGNAHRDIFARMAEVSVHPVCYNGDIFTAEDAGEFEEAFASDGFPMLRAVMLGRGLVRDPLLARRIRGEEVPADALRRFHDRLLEEYRAIIPEENNVLFKMKEVWSYLGAGFGDRAKLLKKIRKASTLSAYREAADRILANAPVL